ncbi:S-layer homology domain-containing protein [Tissierella creatinini]|nr:S-layer homology domain-containing protein [Tissierella creatinini]TJX69077.1 S-layer homology domain-containing protein [Soehngenia saccharolytica]
MKVNRLLVFILAFLFIFNINVAIAAADSTSDTENPSYDAGYEAGFSESKNYSGADGDDEKAYLKYLTTKEFEDLVDSTEDFNLDDFEEGFFEGFEDGLKERTVYDYPTELGKALGSIYGARDFQNGDKSDWEGALPSDKEIRSMFNLSTQDADYREFFIDAFKLAFRDEYILSYDKAQFEPYRVTLAQGIEDGEAIGELMGSSFGYKDFYEKEDKDYTRNLPTDRVIIAEYSLNNDSEEYKEGFLSGFLRMYEEAYNAAYREANMNDTIRDEGDALSSGQEIGKLKGEIQANMDYLQRLSNDWKRSIPNDQYLIMEYDLNLQSTNYRDLFISGFYDGYSQGYNSKYKELTQGAGVGKSVSTMIPLAGGSVLSSDSAFLINILPGTYYHPVQMTVNITYDVGNNVPSSLIKASDSYRVSILNTSSNLNNDKLIELSFEYYGDRIKGGVYKLAQGFWTYIPTEINADEGKITAYVAPNTISSDGSIYAVFLDTGAKFFPDARGHWANEEIYTYVRRNIIYGYPDGTFKPDRQVTRAEFLWLLSRMNRWNLPYYPVNDKLFKDSGTFGASAEVINYAYAQGYITGYPDGTFKPNNHISYMEIETIMGRVSGNYGFKWSDMATKMLYEEKVRSQSYGDMNNKITRAEVIYMLYYLTETMY